MWSYVLKLQIPKVRWKEPSAMWLLCVSIQLLCTHKSFQIRTKLVFRVTQEPNIAPFGVPTEGPTQFCEEQSLMLRWRCAHTKWELKLVACVRLFNTSLHECRRQSAGHIHYIKAFDFNGHRAVQTETSKCLRDLAKSCIIAWTDKRRYEHWTWE